MLPDVPVRQWVLTFPFRLRDLLTYNPKLCAAVRKVSIRTLLTFQRRRARKFGIHDGHSAAVCSLQRAGGSMNINIHCQVLALDGVFLTLRAGSRVWMRPAMLLRVRTIPALASASCRLAAQGPCVSARGRPRRRHGGERTSLERLARYITRPPISVKRLSIADDGRVLYQLKTPVQDGTSVLAFMPLPFIARLAACGRR